MRFMFELFSSFLRLGHLSNMKAPGQQEFAGDYRSFVRGTIHAFPDVITEIRPSLLKQLTGIIRQ